MKKILLVVCLCASSAALATPAIWTGNKQKIETPNGTRWKCEYKIAYTMQMILFWRTFADACPSEVEVYF